MKKLFLKKEVISRLGNDQSSHLMGGGQEVIICVQDGTLVLVNQLAQQTPFIPK